jgi:hypothetical protein
MWSPGTLGVSMGCNWFPPLSPSELASLANTGPSDDPQENA